MSMREYAVDDYGLVINEEAGKLIISKIYENDDEMLDDWAYSLNDEGICEYISEFTGEAFPLRDDGSPDWSDSYSYQSDIISFVQVNNYPTLFKKAYRNIEEVIEEMKDKVGKYLPEDFDYRNNIRQITGTYWG